jgi:acyl-CoA thioester hydrolase
MTGDEATPMTIEVRLRSRDFDQLGHVNQAVYHELLEEARVAFFRVAVPAGLLFVLARVELDHRGEVARGHDRVLVSTSLLRVGRSSAEVAHELRLPDGAVVAEGRSILVAWDPAQRRSRAFTDVERAGLQAVAAADGEAAQPPQA